MNVWRGPVLNPHIQPSSRPSCRALARMSTEHETRLAGTADRGHVVTDLLRELRACFDDGPEAYVQPGEDPAAVFLEGEASADLLMRVDAQVGPTAEYEADALRVNIAVEARTIRAATLRRDELIREAVRTGLSLRAVAQAAGMTHQGVAKIVRRPAP